MLSCRNGSQAVYVVDEECQDVSFFNSLVGVAEIFPELE